MPVVGMSGLDGRSAVETSCGSGRKETRPKGGSVTKKRSKIQQRRRISGVCVAQKGWKRAGHSEAVSRPRAKTMIVRTHRVDCEAPGAIGTLVAGRNENSEPHDG